MLFRSWVTEIPPSAIMITKSLRLNLKLVYQLTQRTMICPSKCRPLNTASTGLKGCILPSSAIGLVCTRTVAASRSRVIHENTTHDTSRNSEEVCSVLPCHVSRINEPQVRFMHQRGGLHCVLAPLHAQTTPGNLPELGIGKLDDFP